MQLVPVVPAHVPPVQTNDVAAGLQLAVSVELLPIVMAAGFAVRVQVGSVAAGAKTVNDMDVLPTLFVTTMLPGPTVAATGTLVVMEVPVLLPILATAPPIVTVAPVKPVPLIVTTLPAVPDDGDIKLIVGGVAVWQASQLVPVAVTQAVSMEAFPLETKRLAHRLLRPASDELGAAGTGPVNWFWETRIHLKAVSPLSEGIDPVNWLVPASKICKADSPLNEGIDPVNWFWLTLKSAKAVSPLSDGIDPVNWFWLTSKSAKAVSPLSEGIVPVNWF